MDAIKYLSDKPKKVVLEAMNRQLPFKVLDFFITEGATHNLHVKTKQGTLLLTGHLLQRVYNDVVDANYPPLDKFNDMMNFKLEDWLDTVDISDDVQVFYGGTATKKKKWPHIDTGKGLFPLTLEQVKRCLRAALARYGFRIFLDQVEVAAHEIGIDFDANIFLESKMKSWWMSKTIIVNIATTAVAVCGVLAGQEWIATHPEAVAVIGMLAGGLNVLLRFITVEPVV